MSIHEHCTLRSHWNSFGRVYTQRLFCSEGLDPAGPLFESQHIKARLDSSDANFVDVIHSNGENLILGGLGMALIPVKGNLTFN